MRLSDAWRNCGEEAGWFVVRRLLYPLSVVMRSVVGLRNKAFDVGILRTTRLTVPVLSVGNLVVGGVGKTPLVQYLAALVQEAGFTTAVVSRGYRRESSGVVLVSDGRGMIAAVADGGDEPVQIARRLPEAIVVVGESRVAAAREAVRLGAQAIVLDDAYQHRYIARDLNLLVVDRSEDLSKTSIVPAGRLREPLASSRRADIVVVSNAPDPSAIGWMDAIEHRKPVACFTYAADRLRHAQDDTEVDALPSGPVLAFSGIGQHANFLRTLETAGIAVGAEMRFGDHHRYTGFDLSSIRERMHKENLGVAVTTEKDVVRLGGLSVDAAGFFRDARVMYLPVTLLFTRGESILRTMVTDCLRQFNSHNMNQIKR